VRPDEAQPPHCISQQAPSSPVVAFNIHPSDLVILSKLAIISIIASIVSLINRTRR